VDITDILVKQLSVQNKIGVTCTCDMSQQFPFISYFYKEGKAIPVTGPGDP
jgi:hypothetical protein